MLHPLCTWEIAPAPQISKRKKARDRSENKGGRKSRQDSGQRARQLIKEFHRYHLAERKDLANIERSYGLRQVQHHINNQQSVLAWIEEWKQASENNPILYYKLQGEEAPWWVRSSTGHLHRGQGPGAHFKILPTKVSAVIRHMGQTPTNSCWQHSSSEMSLARVFQ